MLGWGSKKGVEGFDGLTRRDFLRVGSLFGGAVGLNLADLAQREAAARPAEDIHCILLFLVGGPSHLDTWDLKPQAPDRIRGPFRPIRTNVPGIDICEHFPLMARRADLYSLIRSVHHAEAPVHETGQQLMQTGQMFRGGMEHPHYGAVVSRLQGAGSDGMPPFVVLPRLIGNTGVSISHGQGAGYLGARHEPFCLAADPAPRDFDTLEGACPQAFAPLFAERARKAFDLAHEDDRLRARYGHNTFGQSCLLARRLVEHGVRLVTVNMFDTVFNEITWDCHADGGALASGLDDYRDTLCPLFDAAYTALLDDLKQRGMLANTLVVAMGEFGRTPRLNARGGRDHWPGAWTVLFAGGKVQGGQVIGATDKHGTEPRDRPVSPGMVAASVYRGMGIDPHSRLPGPEGRPLPLTQADPVDELFR